MAIVIALASCLLAGLAAPSLAAAAAGSISGTVTDSVTHTGLERVTVCAYEALESPADLEEEVCDGTDAAGEYKISGLAPGIYKVGFIPDTGVNYLARYYEDTTYWVDAKNVTVASGLDTPGIDAALAAGAEITGTVIDESTLEPIEEVEVCAWQLPNQFQEGRCGWTDEDGEYSITGLEAGTYGVEFWTYQALDYAAEYYSNKDSWATADAVDLSAGETASSIDAALARGGHISGRVTDSSTGVPLGEIWLCAENLLDEEFFRCGYTDASGEYTLRGLGSSEYMVFFSYEYEEGEEEDDYFTQFYNGKASAAEADPVIVSAPATTAGINAALVPKHPSATPVVPGPASTPVVTAPEKKTPLHCRAGFKKKRVNGKQRCVKVHKKRRRHGKRASARTHRAVARLR